MTHIIRLALSLSLVCGSSIAAVRFVADRQPLSAAGLFANPDGSACEHPCLFGIQPGYTSRLDAISLLRRHPLASGIAINVVFDHEELASPAIVTLTIDGEDRVKSAEL